MTPSTQSRCETPKTGGEIQACLSSTPHLPPPPRHQVNFDESIPCPRALITVCAGQGFSAIIIGQTGRWVQAPSCIQDVLTAPVRALNSVRSVHLA